MRNRERKERRREPARTWLLALYTEFNGYNIRDHLFVSISYPLRIHSRLLHRPNWKIYLHDHISARVRNSKARSANSNFLATPNRAQTPLTGRQSNHNYDIAPVLEWVLRISNTRNSAKIHYSGMKYRVASAFIAVCHYRASLSMVVLFPSSPGCVCM